MKRILIFILAVLFYSGVLAQVNSDVILRAKALMERGDNLSAATLLSGSISENPGSRLYLLRGDAWSALGRYSDAINDYNSANRLKNFSGEYGLSRIYALKGDAASSLLHLGNHIDSPFRLSEKEIMLDPAFAVIENTPGWRLFWKNERYSVPEKKLSEIEYCLSSGNRPGAAEILKELISSWPDDDLTIYSEALVDLYDKKYSDAVTALSKLVSADKENVKYMSLLAVAQFESGNPAGASSVYGTLIGKGIDDAQLFIRRAECYRKTGEYEKAISDLVRYIGLYPENREALSLAGKISAESGDNLKAIEYFSTNLKLHPNDPSCYTDRANAYFISRTWESSVKDYSMALDLKPGDPEVWLNKGIALLNMGRSEDACHDFRKALSLGNKKAASYISRNCIK